MPRPPILRAAAALALVAVALTGCTSPRAQTRGSNDGAGVIGIALPTAADAQWSRGGDALRASFVARGYAVDLQFAADDARTQGSQVQNMLTKGADAVVLAPVSVDDLAAPVAAAAEAGVPVVEFGRVLPGLTASAAFGADPAEAGRAQAQALLADLPATASPEGLTAPDAATPRPDDSRAPDVEAPAASSVEPTRLAIIAGSSSDPAEKAGFAAVLEALAPALQAGTVEITAGASLEAAAVDEKTAESQAAAAEKRVRALRSGSTVPTAVLATTDAVTRGVVTALTTAPPADASPSPQTTTDPPPATNTPAPEASSSGPAASTAPIVVGSGADPATIRALRDGDLDATVFADPRALVDRTVDAVVALLAGGGVFDEGGVPMAPGLPGGTVAPSIVRPDDVEELVSSGWVSTDQL